MEYRTLNPDLKLSIMSFDSTRIIHDKELNKELVQKCLEKGINNFYINNYKNSDDIDGILANTLHNLNIPRERIYITTKINVIDTSSNNQLINKKYITEMLEKLNFDYIDIILYGKINNNISVEEACKIINLCIQEGIVKHWGISNWSIKQIENAINLCKNLNLIPPSVIEIEFNILEKYKEDYFELIKIHNLGMMVYSHLKSPILEGDYPQEINIEDSLDTSKENFPKNNKLINQWKNEIFKELKEISEKKLNCTFEQLEIALGLKNPNITTYVLGFSDVKQFEDNIKSLEIYKKLDNDLYIEIKKILDECQDREYNNSFLKNKIRNNKSKFKRFMKLFPYFKKIIIFISMIIGVQKSFPLKDPFTRIDKIRYFTLKNIYKKYLYSLPIYNHTHERNKTIYWCWFQGVENAPELYLSALNSIKINLKDFNIIIIDDNNINNYVTLPPYIMEKYKKGIITPTHLSDILRLELLVKYGGTWADASVLITGYTERFYNTDLFFFQERNPGCIGSSWFISAERANPILRTARDLIYEYWKNNDHLYNYFLFHFFVALASERYKKDLRKIEYISNKIPHTLKKYLLKTFSVKKYNQILNKMTIHKLTIKILYNKTISDNSFYRQIIDEYYPK